MVKTLTMCGLALLITVMAGDEPPANALMIEKNASHHTLAKHDVFSWQTWEKEPSQFVWQFAEREKAYVLHGKVNIKVHGSDEVYLLEKGDFVTFEAGLRTYWHVIEPFKKHVTHEENLIQKLYWKLAFKVQSGVRLLEEQTLAWG